MKTDKGQKVLALILVVGGVLGIAEMVLALASSQAPPLWSYLVYPTPFLLSVIAGIGLWRDSPWGLKLSIGVLVAQVFFLWSPAFVCVFYTGAAVPVVLMLDSQGSSGFSIAAWLGSDLNLFIGEVRRQYALGLNLAAIFALGYLFRLRPGRRDAIDPAERVALWKHPETKADVKPRIKPFF